MAFRNPRSQDGCSIEFCSYVAARSQVFELSNSSRDELIFDPIAIFCLTCFLARDVRASNVEAGLLFNRTSFDDKTSTDLKMIFCDFRSFVCDRRHAANSKIPVLDFFLAKRRWCDFE